MNSDLWPEPEDPNAFLRDSLGEAFQEPTRGSAITDRYECTRWFGFLCLYTSLPTVKCTSLDLLRAFDPEEYENVRARALREFGERSNSSGFVAVPEKLETPAWQRRFPPENADERARDERIREAIRNRGVLLDEHSIGVQASPVAWERDGITENAILRSMELTATRAREIVQSYKASRQQEPRWRDQ